MSLQRCASVVSLIALAIFLPSCKLSRSDSGLNTLTIIPSQGQTVFAVGQTAQFIAIGTFGESPYTRDLTDRVTWISHDVDAATINSTGLATSLRCTTPASGCTTFITAMMKNSEGATITATSSLTTASPTNDAPLPSLTVYKVGQGTGTVVSDPIGINCGSGAGCTANFPLDSPGNESMVTLTETPAAGSVFIGWSANCNADQNPQNLTQPVCSVRMQNNQTVGAIFALK